MSWEMQMLVSRRWEPEQWQAVGFYSPAGFNPFRYEKKGDAERMLARMYPNVVGRIVVSNSVVEECGCA